MPMEDSHTTFVEGVYVHMCILNVFLKNVQVVACRKPNMVFGTGIDDSVDGTLPLKLVLELVREYWSLWRSQPSV